MPKFLIGDKQFLDEVIKLWKTVNEDIKRLHGINRTAETNPQKLFRAFITKTKELGMKRAREAIPKTVRKINELKANLQNLQEDDNGHTEEARLSIVLIKRQIEELERIRFPQTKKTRCSCPIWPRRRGDKPLLVRSQQEGKTERPHT